MNNKITISKLAQAVSEKSAFPDKECEDLLRGFFRIIGQTLREGESVKVKGFGTFKLSKVEARKSVDVTTGGEMVIPPHRKIVFVPAKEMAAKVNAPFEMFETVELSDGVSDEELYREDLPGAEAETVESQNNKDEAVNAPEPETDTIGDVNVGGEDTVEEDSMKEEESMESEGEEEVMEKSEDMQHKEMQEGVHHRGSFNRGFLWGVAAMLIVVCGGLVALWFMNEDFRGVFGGKGKTASVSTSTAEMLGNEDLILAGEENEAEASTGMDGVTDDEAAAENGENTVAEKSVKGMAKVAADEENVAPTKPSDSGKVYDTIGTSRYLTTMAKEHYGNYHLWPYIYEENKAILGHPDRIRPGTRVVIPDLAKYGVDPHNKADIEEAKKKGVAIYARY